MLGVIDRYKKPEQSRLFLCKPNRQIIAELSEAYSKELNTSYNGIHELMFNIPYKLIRNNKIIVNPNFHLIKGDYLIKYVKGNTEEYFVITNPSNAGSEKDEKSVHCFLQPYTLRKKLVRNYKETKKLYDPIGTDGFLNDTLLRKSNWTVGYVDGDILGKYRTVEVSEQSLIEFIETLNDLFECITLWDTKNRTVSFYKEDNFGSDKGLIIEQGKYLKSLSEEPDFDSVATKIYVYGKDDITFNAYNPTGTDFLTSYDFYMYPFERDTNRNIIKESTYMSNELCHALLDYQALLSSKEGSFANLLTQKETKQGIHIQKDTELIELETEFDIIQDQIDLKMAINEDVTELKNQRQLKQAEIDAKKVEIQSVISEITNIDSQITQLKNEVKLENNFTTELIEELNDYSHEKIVNAPLISDEKELYEFAKKEIIKISQPIIHYKLDIIDFTKVVQCQRDWDKLNYGDIVTVRYPNFNVDIKARIISVQQNEDDNSVSIEIANSKDIKSGFLTLKDLYQRTTSSSTTMDMYKPIWDRSEQNGTAIIDLINNEYDATKKRITAGVNESVELTRRGMIIKNPDFPNQMLIGQAGVLALSGDGGETFKTAIKHDRIVAEVVMGKLIAGANLIIENESGNYSIDGNGFNIVSTDEKKKVILDVDSGLKFQTKVNGVYQDKLYYDSVEDELILKGRLDASEITIDGKSVLTDDKKLIKANALEPLEVGVNVIMGANTSISWENVSGKPNTTKIDANGIYTGNISASQITTGLINADISTSGWYRFAGGSGIYESSAGNMVLTAGTIAFEAGATIDFSNNPIFGLNLNVVFG